MEHSLVKHTRFIPHLPCHVPMYCIGNPTKDTLSERTIVYYNKDVAIQKANQQPVFSILLAKGSPVTLCVYTEDDTGSAEEVEIETARIKDFKGFFLYQ